MNLSRRSFLHASLMAGGLVVVPRFGRWFQRVRERHSSTTVTITYWDQWGNFQSRTYDCENVNGVVTVPDLIWPLGSSEGRINIDPSPFFEGGFDLGAL